MKITTHCRGHVFGENLICLNRLRGAAEICGRTYREQTGHETRCEFSTTIRFPEGKPVLTTAIQQAMEHYDAVQRLQVRPGESRIKIVGASMGLSGKDALSSYHRAKSYQESVARWAAREEWIEQSQPVEQAS